MYQVSILSAPYECAFSRNPVLFKFKVNPFAQAEVNSRLRIQIDLYVEDTPHGNDFSKVWSGFSYPNNLGIAQEDLSTVLDAELTFFTPPLKYAQAFKAKGQYKRYYIKYFIIDNQNGLTSPIQSPTYTIVKGGIAKEQLQNDQFFSQNIVVDKQPLNFVTDILPLRPDERKWLYLLLRDGTDPTPDTKLEVNAKIIGGGIIQYDIMVRTMPIYEWEMVVIPIDLQSIDVATNTPPGSLIENISVIFWNDNVKLGEYKYDVDHRPIRNAEYLYYRNSLGAIENQPILGHKEYNTNLDSTTQQTNLIPELLNGVQIQRQQADFWSVEQPSTLGNTGFINLRQLKRLRDLLLNHAVFQILNKRVLPIYINSKQASLYTNKDKLYNLAIEYQPALNDRNYTAEDTIAFDDTCPAVEYFHASQTLARRIHCEWKLPAGYNQIQIHFTASADPNTYEYDLPGNSGTVDLLIPNMPILSGTKTITIKARVICNDVPPGDYGPYTPTSIVDIHSELDPVAVDDIADVSARAFSPRVLQLNNASLNPLANDQSFNLGLGTLALYRLTDSAGVTTITSKNGAGISYNFNTKSITYSPTAASIAILTQDELYYELREYFLPSITNFRTSNLGKISIPLSGQIPPVYVKRVRSNIRKQQFGYGLFSAYKSDEVTSDYYLEFYADAALSTPIDVTGFGLVIAHNVRKTVIDLNSLGVVQGTTNSTTGPVLTNAQGASMPLALNFLDRDWDAGNDDIIDRYLESDAAASTGNLLPVGW